MTSSCENSELSDYNDLPDAGNGADDDTLPSFTVEGFWGERLDKVLATLMPDVSRARLQKLIEEGSVEVNGEVVQKVRQKVTEGDEISLLEEPHLDEALAFTPEEDVEFDVVYEDDAIVVVNKPAGMVAMVSSFYPETPTVAGALAYQRRESGIFHVVNRLDKGTTGLMAVAKSGYVHNLLRRSLHTDDFRREYRGICLGCPEPKSGLIDLPIGRDERSTVKRMIRPDGAPSRSRYEVLEEGNGLALLRLLPETGRTHQLRLHLSAIGHPLAGDWLYGTEDPDLIPRPALHSCALRLRHPVTGELLTLTAPLPEDMQRLLAPK